MKEQKVDQVQRNIDLIVKMKQNESQQAINDVYEQLVAQTSNAKLPEAVFVHHFLPQFSGQATVNNDNKHLMATWIGIAGSPSAEVDIIDQQGNKLYTVPAVMDISILNILNRKAQRSIGHVCVEAGLRSQVMPAAGANFLTQELTNDTTLTKVNQELSEVEQRWLDIFQRYGLANPAQQPEASAAQTDDDLIY